MERRVRFQFRRRTAGFAACVLAAAAFVPTLAAPAEAGAPSPDPMMEWFADSGARARVDDLLATVEPSPLEVVSEDAQLLSLGIDNFGGLWVDEVDGEERVSIAFVPGGRGTRAQVEAVYEALVDAAESEEVSVGALEILTQDDVRVEHVPVRFTFEQLDEWRTLMRPLLADGIASMLDADERENAVTVGVRDLTYRGAVLDHARRVGVPDGAVRVVEVSFSTTLREGHRPVVGGQQIEFIVPPVLGNVGFLRRNCSLGVPVRIANTATPIPGYLTNSHCSAEIAATDGIFHWQPTIPLFGLINTANRMGFEALDPAPFTGNPFGSNNFRCPSGEQCRLGDVAFGIFEPDFEDTPPGFIAIPDGIGTPTWNGRDRFRVTSTGFPQGTVNAVGRTTGRTVGTVINT